MVLVALGLAVFLAAAMTFAWAVQGFTRNAGWVDVTWTFATGAAGVLAAFWPLGEPAGPRTWLVAAMAAIWAARLGLHIAERTWGGHEDVRYARLREQWGAHYPARMFGFLMIQAGAAWVLSLAFLVAARNPAPGLGWADALGAAVLAAAVAGEGLADWQMRRFRRDKSNKGRVMQSGLWAWSRHPNYFFQFFGWLAYPIIAVAPQGSPLVGLIAISAPVFMYWLLAHVSGVPPLEREMLASRGDAWKAYQASTSAFFPLPPRGAKP